MLHKFTLIQSMSSDIIVYIYLHSVRISLVHQDAGNSTLEPVNSNLERAKIDLCTTSQNLLSSDRVCSHPASVYQHQPILMSSQHLHTSSKHLIHLALPFPFLFSFHYPFPTLPSSPIPPPPSIPVHSSVQNR